MIAKYLLFALLCKCPKSNYMPCPKVQNAGVKLSALFAVLFPVYRK